MSVIEQVDQFIEEIRPELAHQLDEAIASLPDAERAAATRCRPRLLNQLCEHTRSANLRHKLRELEAASRPPDAAVH